MKAPHERVRPRIGDVVEIETAAGHGYAQYTFNFRAPPVYGALIRVLPGMFSVRPTDFASLVQERERFFTFFTLGSACARGTVRIVASEPVPERAQGIPLMRMRGPITRDGRVANWWLWDGEREWRLDRLDDEHRDLSILGVMNDLYLVHKIESGWSPRDST
jgi:hypothetical protein